MNQTTLIVLGVGVVLVAAVGAGVYFLASRPTAAPAPPPPTRGRNVGDTIVDSLGAVSPAIGAALNRL